MQMSTVTAAFRLTTFLTILLIVMQSKADPWTIRPAISLDGTFTDNLRLVSTDLKEDDLITILTPGIFIQRQSKRLELALNYRLQGIFYKDNSEENNVINLLDASATSELLKDRFFLDLSSTISEQNISNTGAIAPDNTSLTDNRSEVLTYRVSPYWRQHIGSFMDVELRYERNAVESEKSLDSNNDKFSYNATSGSVFTRILWDLAIDYEKINYEVEDSTEFRTISASTLFLITDKIAFKSVGGYDDNRYTSTNTDIKGYSWRLGGVIKPSRRTSLEATYGERYFGKDLFIEVAIRQRKTQWLFTFSKRPDTTRTTLLEQQVFPLTDVFGNPLINLDTGEQATLNVNVPIQTTEVYIAERLNSTYKYAYRNITMTLSGFGEKREYQVSGLNEEAYGGNLGWTWAVNRNTDAGLSLAFSRNNTFQNKTQEFRVLNYSLKRLVAPDLYASLGYDFVNVESNIAGESYTQNRLTVSISKQF